MEFVLWKAFSRIIERHNGDAGVCTLGCADLFRVMTFSQLTWRESLRDIEACLAANRGSHVSNGIECAAGMLDDSRRTMRFGGQRRLDQFSLVARDDGFVLARVSNPIVANAMEIDRIVQNSAQSHFVDQLASAFLAPLGNSHGPAGAVFSASWRAGPVRSQSSHLIQSLYAKPARTPRHTHWAC